MSCRSPPQSTHARASAACPAMVMRGLPAIQSCLPFCMRPVAMAVASACAPTSPMRLSPRERTCRLRESAALCSSALTIAPQPPSPMSFDPSQSRCNAPLWTPCSALHKTTTQWSSIAHACSCKSQRLDPIALITGQRACTPRLPIGLPLNPTTEKPCATKRPLLSHAAAAASSSSYASSAARSHISLLPREAFGGALGGCASPATRIASHSIDSAPADTRKDGTFFARPCNKVGLRAASICS
mmetsp:Transcript_41418/g.90950  ORF Transcript_41418/g.90950 Transcript_41418/m.90950 type:complete len:243 (-) Transcript_41418:408-1136(-)